MGDLPRVPARLPLPSHESSERGDVVRWLVTGARGLLGQDLVKQLRDRGTKSVPWAQGSWCATNVERGFIHPGRQTGHGSDPADRRPNTRGDHGTARRAGRSPVRFTLALTALRHQRSRPVRRLPRLLCPSCHPSSRTRRAPLWASQHRKGQGNELRRHEQDRALSTRPVVQFERASVCSCVVFRSMCRTHARAFSTQCVGDRFTRTGR